MRRVRIVDAAIVNPGRPKFSEITFIDTASNQFALPYAAFSFLRILDLMALSATIYVFAVRLANADRGVYEELTLRVARHPSETEEYLLTRLLAYCIEYREGLTFSSGLSSPDEPAIAERDLTGALQTWIDVGAPEAARLHKASKAARRVVVYAHRNVDTWLARLQGERIHRVEDLELYVIPPDLLAALVKHLERRMDFELTVSDGTLYISFQDETLSGAIEARQVAK